VTTLRTTAYAAGTGLAIWGLFAMMWTPLGWVSIALGLLIVVAMGLADWIAQTSDCGWSDTVFGREAADFDAIIANGGIE
jgi:hypothetical protein